MAHRSSKCHYLFTEPELTQCQQAVLDAGPPIPGKYIPSCTEAGEYEKMQCHGSIGECWCVNAEGVELVESRQRFSRPDCEAGKN